MGQSVFPALPGLAWGAKRTPNFVTMTHRSVSGRELRATYQQYPLWTFSLSFEFLRDGARGADYDTIVGFFLSRQGSFDSFLFTDPADNTVADMRFGTGDGSTRGYQLARGFGAGGSVFAEPVQNVKAITNVKVDGVATAAYAVDGNGYLTFTVAPAAASVLTWSGSYYYRCRFTNDLSEASLFMQDLWEMTSCEFVGAVGNRV